MHPTSKASRLNFPRQPCSSAQQPNLGVWGWRERKGSLGLSWLPGGQAEGQLGSSCPAGSLVCGACSWWPGPVAVESGLQCGAWGPLEAERLALTCPQRPVSALAPRLDFLLFACLGVTSLQPNHPHLDLPVSERPRASSRVGGNKTRGAVAPKVCLGGITRLPPAPGWSDMQSLPGEPQFPCSHRQKRRRPWCCWVLQAGALVTDGAGESVNPVEPIFCTFNSQALSYKHGWGRGRQRDGKGARRFPTVPLGVRCPSESCIFVT